MWYGLYRNNDSSLIIEAITMFTEKDNATIVGVSELRSGLEKILEKARRGACYH